MFNKNYTKEHYEEIEKYSKDACEALRSLIWTAYALGYANGEQHIEYTRGFDRFDDHLMKNFNFINTWE